MNYIFALNDKNHFQPEHTIIPLSSFISLLPSFTPNDLIYPNFPPDMIVRHFFVYSPAPTLIFCKVNYQG
jgi:hypothetical protein